MRKLAITFVVSIGVITKGSRSFIGATPWRSAKPVGSMTGSMPVFVKS